jgi:hypothetical protein
MIMPSGFAQTAASSQRPKPEINALADSDASTNPLMATYALKEMLVPGIVELPL